MRKHDQRIMLGIECDFGFWRPMFRCGPNAAAGVLVIQNQGEARPGCQQPKHSKDDSCGENPRSHWKEASKAYASPMNGLRCVRLRKTLGLFLKSFVNTTLPGV